MAEEDNNNPETPEADPAEENSATAEESAPAEESSAEESAPVGAAEDKADASEKGPVSEGGDSTDGAGEKGPEGDKKKEEKKDIFAEIMGEEAADAVKIHKAKSSKNVTKGIVHISATFNNTMVTITDATGNTIGWSSAGKMGFKGSRKSTAYAAQVVSQDACRQAMGHGLKEAEVRVKGPGAGRESAVRAVQAIGIDVSAINDVTPIPDNGCRPKKARRV